MGGQYLMSYQQAAELWLADNWLRMTSCQFGGTGRKDWKGTKGWKAAEARSAYWNPRRKGLLERFLLAAQSAQPKRLLLLGTQPKHTVHSTTTLSEDNSQQPKEGGGPSLLSAGWERTHLTSDLNWRHWQVHKPKGRPSTPSYSTW